MTTTEETMMIVPCPCTLIEQDEDCPVGYPSLICGVCDGIGIATIEQVTALACEMIKIASDIGEPDDPFAAWETIELLKSRKEMYIFGHYSKHRLSDGVFLPLSCYVPTGKDYTTVPLYALKGDLT